MTALYAALAVGGALIGVDAWFRWQDKRAAMFAEITSEDDE